MRSVSSSFLRTLSDFKIRDDERWPFFCALALVALARAQAAFDFTYSVDDYRVIITGFHTVDARILLEGRFGTYWLSRIFDLIGFDPTRAPLITIVASIFLSVWAANVILRLWSDELSPAIRTMLLVIIAAHPYTAEILTFRNIAIYHVLSFALGAAAILIARLSPGRLTVSILLFAASLTFYQVPLNYVSIFICFDMALRIIRSQVRGDETPLAFSLKDRSFYARMITFAAGFLLYFVCLKIANHGLEPHPFAIPIELSQVPERLRTWGVDLLVGHFLTGAVYDNPLVAKPIMMIPLIFIAATVFELLRRAPKHFSGSILAGAVVLITPVLAGLAMLGIPLLFTIIWLPSRVMASIGVIWAGVAVTALLVRAFIPKQVYSFALGVIVFSFIAQNNQIFIDQGRVGVRDHNLTIRLIAKLEEQPNYSEMKAVAVVGTRSDSGGLIPTATHGYNDSNFEYSWAVAPMLSELSGIPLRPAYTPELEAAKAYCKDRAIWPAPGSLVIQGELAIVCMTPVSIQN